MTSEGPQFWYSIKHFTLHELIFTGLLRISTGKICFGGLWPDSLTLYKGALEKCTLSGGYGRHAYQQANKLIRVVCDLVRLLLFLNRIESLAWWFDHPNNQKMNKQKWRHAVFTNVKQFWKKLINLLMCKLIHPMH